ncbi:hypothetical protein [Kitasatospora sp. NPDC001683]
MSALVARPTENAGIDLALYRPTPARSRAQLLRLIAWAKRVGDEHGRRLFEARLRRPVGGSTVGEWS